MTSHFVPPANYTFPSVYMNGCNREFKSSWLKKYNWLVYSPSLDGVLCLHCALFSDNRKQKGALVNRPFNKWTKISSELADHANNAYHSRAMSASKLFVDCINKPELTLPDRFDTTRRQRRVENRHILKMIIKAILFCGKQCIALRGDHEQMSGMGNPGNFLSLLSILSEHDELLQRHLQAPRDKSAQYMSPQIQNELLSVLSKMILNDILKEIRKAKFFAIMADEATSHNDEQLSLCLRFVDEGKNIREEFIEFVHMDNVSGHSIATAILHSLDEKQLDATHIRAQTYDGAAAMSSENVGVQKRIREVSPLAMYSHCAGHCLNLVIVHSCKIPLVRNTIDKMKEVCLFFNYSPKREGLLQSVISKEVLHAEKRKPLLNLCATRWAERHSAYSHFYASYVYMVYSLEVIAHGLHQDKGYDHVQGNWASKTKQDASGLLASITSFDFILSFVTVYVLLSHLDGISKKLQSSSQDIFQAYEMVTEVTQVYRKLRDDVVVHFGRCYAQAVRMAEKIGTTPDMPRIAKRQIHRSNTPAATPEEYYRLNLAIPFLDHISNEFEQQFTGLSAKCGKLIGLVPTVLMSEDVEPDFEEVVNTYTDDLPSPELFHHELFRWKLYLSDKFDDNLPSSIAETIKICDQAYFPNIYVLLQIAATIPATSCECERSFSALRRLNTFNRACMGQKRLSALALIHIHYDKELNLDDAVDIFAKLHPRRMDLQSIIFHDE